jgi:K+-transporting ATPase ATPase C chain
LAAAAGYDARNSSGSNLSPSSAKFTDRIKADVARFGVLADQIRSDLLIASGSGLDPGILPPAARSQAARTAAARHLNAATVASLVERSTEPAALGILDEARVNARRLNIALDPLSKNANDP